MNLNNQVEEKKELTVEEETEVQTNEAKKTAKKRAVKKEKVVEEEKGKEEVTEETLPEENVEEPEIISKEEETSKEETGSEEDEQKKEDTIQAQSEDTTETPEQKPEPEPEPEPRTKNQEPINQEPINQEPRTKNQSTKNQSTKNQEPNPEAEQIEEPAPEQKDPYKLTKEEEEEAVKALEENREKSKSDTEHEGSPEPKDEIDKDEELAQYMETFKNYKQGDIIKGIIVGINDKEVLVDISYKSEGSITISEFSGCEQPKINQEIWVYYEKSENADGKVSLSKKKADFHLALDKLDELYENNGKVEGVVRKRIRGGMIVEVLGIEAFLPGSHVSTKPVPNLDHFINRSMTFKIVNLDKEKKNVIVSRKKVIDEERKEKIDKLLDKIHVGAELDGEVKNITDYGAFVDLGGLDGLLHITDMTWGQISHPSEMLNISDKVKVKVIDYKPQEERISLGLKQLVPHPWENVEAKYEEGARVTVKVVSLTPYGAFVELEPGVEGLVHISEMSWTKRITNPKQLLKAGDVIDAIILYVSRENKKISLGIKQMEPNPWLTIDERYPVGKIIKGNIKSITPFGAFIEIEKDIDGLVHISDMSWTKRVSHPKEVLKKGQQVEAVILSIDKHLHRIAMGMKQLTVDPWENLEQKLPVNTEVVGKIVNIIAKGVLVQVDVEDQTLEGFVPISHLAIPRLERPDYAFSVGDELPMKVIELDMENRRLIFSVKAYLFSKEREVLQEFLAKYEPSPKKIAEKKEAAKKRNAEKKKAAEKKKGDVRTDDKKSGKQTDKPSEEKTTSPLTDSQKQETIPSPPEQEKMPDDKEEKPEIYPEETEAVADRITEEKPETAVEDEPIKEEAVPQDDSEPVSEEKTTDVPVEEPKEAVPQDDSEPVSDEKTTDVSAEEPKEAEVETDKIETIEVAEPEKPELEPAPSDESTEVKPDEDNEDKYSEQEEEIAAGEAAPPEQDIEDRSEEIQEKPKEIPVEEPQPAEEEPAPPAESPSEESSEEQETKEV